MSVHTKTNMFGLPLELQRLIYEYDNTYRFPSSFPGELYQQCFMKKTDKIAFCIQDCLCALCDDDIFWKNDLVSTNTNDKNFITPDRLGVYFEICKEYDTNIVKFKLFDANTDSTGLWSSFDGCIVQNEHLDHVTLERFTYRTEVCGLTVCFN